MNFCIVSRYSILSTPRGMSGLRRVGGSGGDQSWARLRVVAGDAVCRRLIGEVVQSQRRPLLGPSRLLVESTY